MSATILPFEPRTAPIQTLSLMPLAQPGEDAPETAERGAYPPCNPWTTTRLHCWMQRGRKSRQTTDTTVELDKPFKALELTELVAALRQIEPVGAVAVTADETNVAEFTFRRHQDGRLDSWQIVFRVKPWPEQLIGDLAKEANRAALLVMLNNEGEAASGEKGGAR